MMQFFVVNNVTGARMTYTDLVKARIAVEYLTFTDGPQWSLEITVQ